MHNNLQEQLNAIDDEMIEAVMDGNERIIAQLQKQRIELEQIMLGNGPIA